ncbi:cleft lip and palate transmembrane family protein [Plasmopara halstedii]|uniref:Cleft lip and palate transmembrane family protein n=1 Tax=Plasmopara halstedii TaxID=4781 RepID=A0A0P1AHK8_PLAHL|nr:cleft lip and palate transmembrane family protein [Plasmopara halstedii]CEG40164.1 cleft lip and palate transmembrane family protein [Plasmopara halstedii]|eukprot:XP_024576533.1 cleft lip and palate transmembrane family protein [Plasmopara halstedii]
MAVFKTLLSWVTFTTVSCVIFFAYMSIVGHNIYRIMYPAFPESSNTLDPLWEEGQLLGVNFYLSDRIELDATENFYANAVPVGGFESLTFDWESSNFRRLDVNVSRQTLIEMAGDSKKADNIWNALKGNASVFLQVHVRQAPFSSNPKDQNHIKYRSIYKSSNLIKYATSPNAKNSRLLLAPVQVTSSSNVQEKAAVTSYWKTAVDVQLVTDFTRFPIDGLPLLVYNNLNYIQHPEDNRWRYLPALSINDMPLAQHELVPLNSTLDDGSSGEVILPLRLSWSPLSYARWQMQLTFASAFVSQEKMGVPSSDLDALRSMVTDTHPILLTITMSVALLHILFDWLAFRHDVSYWRAKGDNVVGVSLRAMVAELGSQIVVLLYLIDQDSTLLVTGPQCLSVVLLIWKVTKVQRAQRRLHSNRKASAEGIVDKNFTMDEHTLRLLEETQRADSLATSHMLFVLTPLAAGYAMYSLIYVPHAGWYTWFLESLTTTVYALGFVFMLPQLVINYRLKSVAHLQWRLLIYRALNTFIDDLFAFVIKMPTLHRISCFRDDIVFIVYLYQRWIYPVDLQRLEDEADGTPVPVDLSSKPHGE